MITYIVLALSLLASSVVQAQTETYWTGGGANNTWSNTDNWSNGVPTETSIARINSTGCYNCEITVDEHIVLHSLYVTFGDYYGAQITITASITVTNTLYLGNETNAATWGVSIFLQDGGELHLADGSETWIWYNYNRVIYTYTSGKIVNNGTVNIKSSAGQTGPSYVTIGYSESYPLTIDNRGAWKAEDPLLYVIFYEIDQFNHYSGNYTGTYVSSTTDTYPEATIQFRDTNFNIEGVDDDDNTDASETFLGPTYYYSSSSNSYYYYGSDVKRVVLNTTNINLAWARFEGVNILFNYNGTIRDSNFTSYATVNSTSGSTAFINGTNVLYSLLAFAAVNPGDALNVVIQNGAVLTSYGSSANLGIYGNTIFINNGQFNDGDIRFYLDETAWLFNYGLITLANSDYLILSTSGFENNPNPTTVGNVVNRGTIELIESSTFSYYETGVYHQCSDGAIKYGIGLTSGSSSTPSITFKETRLDGYFLLYLGDNYDLTNYYYTALFSYDYSASSAKDVVFDGSFSTQVTWETGTAIVLVCVYKTTGYVYINEVTTSKLTCDDWNYGSELFTPLAAETVCDGIIEFEDIVAACPKGSCGTLQTKPIETPSAPSSSALLQASLALLLSALGFLLY
jgi:hypothetical protein